MTCEASQNKRLAQRVYATGRDRSRVNPTIPICEGINCKNCNCIIHQDSLNKLCTGITKACVDAAENTLPSVAQLHAVIGIIILFPAGMSTSNRFERNLCYGITYGLTIVNQKADWLLTSCVVLYVNITHK